MTETSYPTREELEAIFENSRRAHQCAGFDCAQCEEFDNELRDLFDRAALASRDAGQPANDALQNVPAREEFGGFENMLRELVTDATAERLGDKLDALYSRLAQLGAGHAEAPREDATQEITNDEARRAAGLFFGTGRSSMLREEDGVIFAKILEDFRSRRAARSSGKTGAK